MFRRVSSIILLTILTALPAAAMVGQFCHVTSGMDCCVDETGCQMPMNETKSAMATSDPCPEMCTCTFERRESPVAAPAENRQIVSFSATQPAVGSLIGPAFEKHYINFRPPLISDRGDTYLQNNCFRI